MGGRTRDTVPFTADGKPAILLPEKSRYTLLAMRAAHEVAHTGVGATVIQYRTDGYWSVRAGMLAKSIKSRCVVCRYLDRPMMVQRMGQRPMEFAKGPSVWKQVEIDLLGPFFFRGDKNPRTTVKV